MTDSDLLNNTPLHIAAENNDTAAIDLLVRQGADVNAQNSSDETPLICAAKENNIEALKILVEVKADINHIDNSGFSALAHAAGRNGSKALECLLKHGANPNPERPEESSKDLPTPIQPLVQAIKKHEPANAIILLNNGALFDTDIGIETPQNSLLTMAREARDNENDPGKKKIWKELLKQIGELRKEVRVRLLKSLEDDDAELFKQVTSRKNISEYTNRTPLLHLAAEYGAIEITKSLIAGNADLATYNSDNEGPLHIAAKHGKIDLIEYLVNSNLNVDDTQFIGSRTPLFSAIINHQCESIKKLASLGANVNNTVGTSPLLAAAQNATPDLIHLLIENGLKINSESLEQSSDLRNIITTSFLYPGNAMALIELGVLVQSSYLEDARINYRALTSHPEVIQKTSEIKETLVEQWKTLIRQLEILVNKGQTNLQNGSSSPGTSLISSTANLLSALTPNIVGRHG